MHTRGQRCPKCRVSGRVYGDPLGTACAPARALGQVMVPDESTVAGRVRDHCRYGRPRVVPYPTSRPMGLPATKAQRSARAYHHTGESLSRRTRFRNRDRRTRRASLASTSSCYFRVLHYNCTSRWLHTY